jgi:hypothetical protein
MEATHYAVGVGSTDRLVVIDNVEDVHRIVACRA